MKKKILLAIVLLLAMAQAIWAVEVTGTFADAKAKAAELKQPLLIDFMTDW